MIKWNANRAIKRPPNNYEHVGLCAEDARDRMLALVEAAYNAGHSKYLISHFKELAFCLPCRREYKPSLEAIHGF